MIFSEQKLYAVKERLEGYAKFLQKKQLEMITCAKQLRARLMDTPPWNDDVYARTVDVCNEYFKNLNKALSMMDQAVFALKSLIEKLDVYFSIKDTI